MARGLVVIALRGACLLALGLSVAGCATRLKPVPAPGVGASEQEEPLVPAQVTVTRAQTGPATVTWTMTIPKGEEDPPSTSRFLNVCKPDRPLNQGRLRGMDGSTVLTVVCPPAAEKAPAKSAPKGGVPAPAPSAS